MQRFLNKVVFVTGGARGQGRSHAVRFAQEGADVVLCDLLADVETVPYGLGTPDDLAETGKSVENEGRRCLALTADLAVGLMLGREWTGVIAPLRWLSGAGFAFGMCSVMAAIWYMYSLAVLTVGSAGLKSAGLTA